VEAVTPPRRHLLWLLGAGLVLCCFGLMWGLPHLFDFAQDSVVPIGALAEKNFSFEEITAHRYPPFHFWLLRAAFLPARAVIAMTSPNDKVRSTLFILSARLVSVAMALGTLLWLFAAARRLWDERSGLVAALLLLFSPLTLYYAKNANLDVPYLFWLAAAFFFYLRVLQGGRRFDYLGLGLTAALAVCTKDQAYGFILLMPLPILIHVVRDRSLPAGAKVARLAWGGGAFLFAFAVIDGLLFNPGWFVKHLQVITGPGSEGWRLFRPGPVGQLRLLVETFLRLMDAWTVAGIVLVVIGLAAAFRHDGRRWLYAALLLPAAGYYLGFLAVVGYVPTRFVLPMMLPLALFGGRGVRWLWERRSGAGRVAAAVLMLWVALAGLSLDWVMANYPRYDAQRWMDDHVSPDATIRYIGDVRDMPRINEPFDPHHIEGTAEALREAEPRPDLVIISMPQGERGSGSRCLRPSSLIRAHLGNWGLTASALPPAGPTFQERLLSGEFGFVELKRFQSPISAFVPEVSESANRTIVFLVNENGR
jgi:hypothetical protein